MMYLTMVIRQQEAGHGFFYGQGVWGSQQAWGVLTSPTVLPSFNAELDKQCLDLLADFYNSSLLSSAVVLPLACTRPRNITGSNTSPTKWKKAFPMGDRCLGTEQVLNETAASAV